MYENRNGFFQHVPIAYKYYDLSVKLYFTEFHQLDIAGKETIGSNFSYAFSKVAYYYGYLAEPIDNEAFFSFAYLGHQHEIIICSFYYAHALLFAQGCDRDVNGAIEIYQQIFNENLQTRLGSCAMARLAKIYRDVPNISNGKEKYLDCYNYLQKKYGVSSSEHMDLCIHFSNKEIKLDELNYLSNNNNNRELWEYKGQFDSDTYSISRRSEPLITRSRKENDEDWDSLFLDNL